MGVTHTHWSVTHCTHWSVTHTGQSHTVHTGQSHTHTLVSHTHTHWSVTHTHWSVTHTHWSVTHTHTGQSHTHTGQSHTHTARMEYWEEAERSQSPYMKFDLRQKARSPDLRSHYRSKSGSHGAFISLPALPPGGKSHRDNNENKFLSLLNTHVGSTFEDRCDNEQNAPKVEQKNSFPSLIRPPSLGLRRKRDRNRHGNNEPSWVSAILEYECTVPNICYDQMEYEEYCKAPAGQDEDQGYVNEQPLMPMECSQHKSLTMTKKANARQQRQRQDSGKKRYTLTNNIKRIVNISKDTTEHNENLEKKMKMTGRKKNSAHYGSNDYPDSTAWDTVLEENVGRFDKSPS